MGFQGGGDMAFTHKTTCFTIVKIPPMLKGDGFYEGKTSCFTMSSKVVYDYTINFDWVMKLMMFSISGPLSISFLMRMAASCGLMLD